MVIGLVALGIVGIVATMVWVADAGRPPASPTTRVSPSGPSPASGVGSLAELQGKPHVVFQNVARGDDYAKVSIAALDVPAAGRIATDLVCERVHFGGGQGICLAAEHGVNSSYYAVTFGSNFAPRTSIPLDGSPNLARVSPDGRYAAATVITVQATEEEDPRNQTLLIDMASDTVVADLEEFSVTREGALVQGVDLDFWGASFATADSNRFYATVRISGNVHLAEGDVAGRTMRVIHPNVSAPSISPDGTRIAYAKLITNIGPTWRFHVLDLSNLVEIPLAEARSIDDQPEWLDDAHVLYGFSTDLFVVMADGSGTPQLFLEDGLSPGVVR